MIVDGIYSREEQARDPRITDALRYALARHPRQADETEHQHRLRVRGYVEAILGGPAWQVPRNGAETDAHEAEEPSEAAAVAPTDATDAVPAPDDRHDPWSRAVPASALLSEPEAELEWLARDLAAPGSITGLAAPRGLGKTHVAHALAVAVATGGTFRGARVPQGRVLLIDRDNSRREVRRRLRGWAGGAALNALEVLTRDDAPALTDARAWVSFPFARYALVILDSLGAATEGVSEQDGGEAGEALAPLLDLARRGPAVFVLLNVPKDGRNYRGSGIIADRLDILYEVRDATDLTPAASDATWWAQLPEAGEAAWAERAQRRGRRDDYRLALVPSKFRVGEEPDPIALEVDLTPGAWTLRDVTEDLMRAHDRARGEATAAAATARTAALDALAATVSDRYDAGEPLHKRAAEDELAGHLPQVRRAERRALIEAGGEGRWRIGGAGTKGDPLVLVPADAPVFPASAARIGEPARPRGSRASEALILADRASCGRPESAAPKTATGADFREAGFWPPTAENTPDGLADRNMLEVYE